MSVSMHKIYFALTLFYFQLFYRTFYLLNYKTIKFALNDIFYLLVLVLKATYSINNFHSYISVKQLNIDIILNLI